MLWMHREDVVSQAHTSPEPQRPARLWGWGRKGPDRY